MNCFNSSGVNRWLISMQTSFYRFEVLIYWSLVIKNLYIAHSSDDTMSKFFNVQERTKGIIVPLVTWLDASGNIDLDSMGTHVDRLILNGCNGGIFILGTTGEFPYIPFSEKQSMMAYMVTHVKGRVPVLAGISAPGVKETVQLGQAAIKAGIDGVFAIVPQYFPLDQGDIESFYRKVADGLKGEIPFWDLGGQERFRFMHSSYMKGSVAALLFFDIARINTVFELAPWIQLIRTYAIPNAPILLVGTKTDVIDESMRAFAVAEGNRIIEEHGLESLVLTSSKTGENIHAAIERLVDILLGNIPRCYAFEDMRAVPPVEKVMTTDPPRFDVYKRTKPVEATSASAMNFVPAIDQLESRRHGRISWGQGRKKNDML